MARKKILIVAEGVTLAHVARSLAIAESYCDQFDIELAADPRWHDLIATEGWQSQTISSLATQKFLERLARGRPVYRESELVDYVLDDMALFEVSRPDVVVGDFRISLAVSARRVAVPYVNICNAYWHPLSGISRTIPELPITKYLGVTAGKMLFNAFGGLIMRRHCHPMNRLRLANNIGPVLTDIGSMYMDADLVAFADPEIYYKDMVESYRERFIGPIVWSPKLPLPPWWADVPTDRPIVFVSLGSSGQVDVLNTLVEAGRRMNLTLLVATAGRIKCTSSARCFVADFLPGPKVVEIASLVICNGGNPMTSLAHAGGCPVIGIPSNMDQFLNMATIERAGSGKSIRPERLRVTRVSNIIGDVLVDPEIKRRAKEMAAVSAEYRSRRVLGSMLGELTN